MVRNIHAKFFFEVFHFLWTTGDSDYFSSTFDLSYGHCECASCGSSSRNNQSVSRLEFAYFRKALVVGFSSTRSRGNDPTSSRSMQSFLVGGHSTIMSFQGKTTGNHFFALTVHSSWSKLIDGATS